MTPPGPDARLLAADRGIALLCAMGYMQGQFPGAQLEWGDTKAPPDPDDIDQIWHEPVGGTRQRFLRRGGSPTSSADSRGRWFAVTAVSGTYGPAERSYSWGQRVLAGTRDYLVFAIGRLRERGQGRLADALETEMLADRLVYLLLTTTVDTAGEPLVQARQYDISDATLAGNVLAAVRDHDEDRIENLKQALGQGAADLLTAAYWTLPGWFDKALLGRVACCARDHSHAGLRKVFEDLLGIDGAAPGVYGDMAREARARALTWLDDNHDPDSFVRLYEDEEAQAAGIARYRHPAP